MWNFRQRFGLKETNPPTPGDFVADKDLNALFLDTLKDIYYAEKQIYKSLPKMAKAANSDQLRAAFEKHHDETEGQIGRLEQIFELLDKPARGKKCVTQSKASLMKAPRSWTNTRVSPRSTPACWLPPKPSSITKFLATGR
jgi:hypothetical protein